MSLTTRVFNRDGNTGSGFIAKFDIDNLEKDLHDATVLITNHHVFTDKSTIEMSTIKKSRIKFHGQQSDDVGLSKLLKDPLVFKSSPIDEVCVCMYSLFKCFHTQQQT